MRPDEVLEVMGLDLLIRSTMLVATAWIIGRFLRAASASAATRHLAWAFGIGGVLFLPALAAFLPDLPLPLPAANPGRALAGLPSAGDLPFRTLGDGGIWGELLGTAYLVVAGGLAARLVHARWKLAGIWSAAEEPVPAWSPLLNEQGAALRLSRTVELRLSREAVVPMTWGTFRPKILLPAESREWSLERRRLVLMHELAHVARCDGLGQSAASLACALYWFNPAIWFAARQMRVEQEHAADDLVLAAGAAPLTYAQCLLELARNVGCAPPAIHAAATGGPSQLERRLVSIVATGTRQELPGYRTATGAVLAICTLLASTAVPAEAVVGIATDEDAGAAATRYERTSEGPRRYTAIGSAPPEAAGPHERPERMPVTDRASGHGTTRPDAPDAAWPAIAPDVASAPARAERRPAPAEVPVGQPQRARPPAFSAGIAPPSRERGLSGVPATYPLSPSGVPRPPRPGQGPLPPRSGSSP